MRRLSPDAWAVAALALVALAVIGPSLVPGRAFVSVHPALRPPFGLGLTETFLHDLADRGNFETGDQLFQVLPERRAFLERLSQGELPLWWREAGGGISLMGAPGGEFTEPRVLVLSALLGPIEALGVLAVLTIFVLASTTYAFLRVRGLSPLASATGGLAFALSGALASNWYYVCKVDALVLLPAGLLALELWLRGSRRSAFLILAFGAADSALASFPQNTATAAYALLLLGALRLRQEKGSGRGFLATAAWLVAALVLGLAVASFHLLPVAEWGAMSDRGFSLAGGGFVFAPAHALSLLAPLAVGDPTSRLATEWNPLPEVLAGLRPYSFTETTLYVGIVGLPLALLGGLTGRRALLPAVGFVFALLIAAGTPLAWLPGVGVSAPSRALAIASFFLAWLVAEGMDAGTIASEPGGGARPKVVRAIVAAAFLWFLALAVAATWIARSIDAASLAEAALAARARAGLPPSAWASARQGFHDRWAFEVVPELQHTARAALLSAAVFALGLWRRRLRFLWTVALAADLASLAMHLTPPLSTTRLLEETPEVRAVRDGAEGGRLVRMAPELPLTNADHEIFQATLPPWYGISDTAAYVVMPNAGQAALLRAHFPELPSVLLGDTYLTALPRTSADSPLLDLLGVSFVLSRARLDHPSLVLRCERSGFHGYQRTTYRGHAWIVPRAVRARERRAVLEATAAPGFDPGVAVVLDGDPAEAAVAGAGGGTCQVDFPDSRRARYRIRGTGGGYLVTTDPFVPGWTATLDGRPAEILRGNGVFQCLWIPAGDHVVETQYLPRSFVLGSVLSGLSLVLLAWLAARLPRRAHGTP